MCRAKCDALLHLQEDKLWQGANAAVRDFVLKLLHRSPNERMSAKDALQHPWLTTDLRVEKPLTEGGDAAVSEKQERLRKAAAQAHVEDFMRLMARVSSFYRRHTVDSPLIKARVCVCWRRCSATVYLRVLERLPECALLQRAEIRASVHSFALGSRRVA